MAGGAIRSKDSRCFVVPGEDGAPAPPAGRRRRSRRLDPLEVNPAVQGRTGVSSATWCATHPRQLICDMGRVGKPELL